MKGIVGFLLCIPFVALLVITSLWSIDYRKNIGGHLQRAANANTISIAHSELKTALSYMEKYDMTGGYTSVVYNTPDEDVGYWYNNLKTAEQELAKLEGKEISPLEQSNVLMKLRETLIEHKQKGESITEPPGISRFPHNGMVGFAGFISFLFLIVGCGLIHAQFNE